MTDEEIEVIVKPIFIKMFNANFSAREYGIECYKKGMEYQGIKELAIENDNLIKGINYLKAQIEKMKCCKEEILNAIKNETDCEWLKAHNGVAKYIYTQTVIDIINKNWEIK